MRGTYVKVIKLMLTATPNAVVEVVVISNEAQPLVRVVPLESSSEVSFTQSKAPVFDVDVLSSCFLGF